MGRREGEKGEGSRIGREGQIKRTGEKETNNGVREEGGRRVRGGLEGRWINSARRKRVKGGGGGEGEGD